MSRPHHHYTKHNTKPDRHAVFPVVILIACLVWVHKAAMTRVEHLLPAVLLVVAGIVGLVVFSKLVMKIGWCRRLHNPTMTIIDNMTGLEFERYVAKLLKARGYKNIKLTEQYDLGLDIVAEKDGIRWGLQVKRYSGLVKANAVRQVVTALRSYNCDKAMVVTNSTFSQTAKKLARSNDCVLINRNILMKWFNY